MDKVELRDFAGGALQEQFQKAFEKVVENLQNPNTSFKAARKISIELKFEQNESRDDVKCKISVTEKLAPQDSLSTNFAIGKDLRSGKLYAEEYGKHIKGQLSFDDCDNDVVDGRKVDTETGEIKETVLDFRKVAND